MIDFSGQRDAVPNAILRCIERRIGDGDHILYRFTDAFESAAPKLAEMCLVSLPRLKRECNDRLA
jgi:hypothetical protein